MTADDAATAAVPGAAHRGASAGAEFSWRLPAGEYVHLVYLANMVWQPFFDPGRSAWDWLFVAGVALLFLPLYVLAHQPSDRLRTVALVGTVVLGTLATLVNVGASVLFVYAAANAAWIGGRSLLRWQVGLTALCGVLAVVSPVAWPFRLYGVLPAVVFVWLIGWLVAGDVRREQELERLRVDAVRMEQLAAADERERIARDLHDLLGQSLTGLVVQAQLVQGLVDTDREAARDRAAELEATARDALARVRHAIDGLGQVALDDELEAARRTLEAAGVELVVDRDAAGRPGPLVERLFALAVREATTNVVRHARATTCRVTVTATDRAWLLRVADDGIGGSTPDGNGLRGMRERVLAVAGTMQRDGRNGTTVTIEVPRGQGG